MTNETVSAVRRELLDTINHEVRTPMTSILGLADLLLEDGDLEYVALRRADAVARIKSNGARLLEFFDKLLELRALESEFAAPGVGSFAPEDMLSELHREFAPIARAEGLEFSIQRAGGLPAELTGDRAGLLRALQILVGNAIRFTESGTVSVTLRVTGWADRPLLRAEVSDSGPGLSAEQLATLFEPLVGPSSDERSYGGRGLGLAIAEQLVRRMEGSIDVETELGVGTRFVLAVPIGRVGTAVAGP